MHKRILTLFTGILLTASAIAQQVDYNTTKLRKPIVSGLKGTIFMTHVNTYHPNGFYFMSYLHSQYTNVSFINEYLLGLTWEITLGAVNTGALEMTRYEAIIDVRDLKSAQVTFETYQPNENHPNFGKYAAIQLYSGSKKAVNLTRTYYTVDSDDYTKIGEESGYLNQVEIPYSDMGQCTDCKPSIYLERIVDAFNELRKTYIIPTGQSNFDEPVFRRQLLTLLKSKDPKTFLGTLLRTDKSKSSPRYIHKSKLPLFDFNLSIEAADDWPIYYVKAEYKTGNASYLFNRIEDALKELPGYISHVESKTGKSSDVTWYYRQIKLQKIGTQYFPATFTLTDDNVIKFTTSIDVSMKD